VEALCELLREPAAEREEEGELESVTVRVFVSVSVAVAVPVTVISGDVVGAGDTLAAGEGCAVLEASPVAGGEAAQRFLQGAYVSDDSVLGAWAAAAGWNYAAGSIGSKSRRRSRRDLQNGGCWPSRRTAHVRSTSATMR
jgi:hypothetical protein